MSRNDNKGDQPSGGETTWTNTGAIRSGRGKHKTGLREGGMLRHSPNHRTLQLPNGDDDDDDDDDDICTCSSGRQSPKNTRKTVNNIAIQLICRNQHGIHSSSLSVISLIVTVHTLLQNLQGDNSIET